MPMKQDFTKYQEGEPPRASDQAPGTIISLDTLRDQRLPPGQTRTRKWPVLHWKRVPNVSLEDWRLEINGRVDTPLQFTWSEFIALPRVRLFADFHCVTRWSRLGNLWEGVSVRELLARAGVQSQAQFLIAGGYDDGWTTNMPIRVALADDAVIADRHDGEPISADHGGPARLIIPGLYAWKSAKWLKSLTLLDHDEPGFWERGGYHNQGDPWTQQRHSW